MNNPSRFPGTLFWFHMMIMVRLIIIHPMNGESLLLLLRLRLLRTSVLDEHIDNLQAEVTELRAQLANKRTELEALWNECRGAPPSTRPLRSACSTPTRSDHACTHIPCTATVLQCYPLKPARPRCTTTRLAPTAGRPRQSSRPTIQAGLRA